LIALVGVIVPRRLRANWRQEWEAELRHREAMLAEWDRLNWRARLDLMWRSTSAFWDALWLQPKRLEDEMIQDICVGIRMLRQSRAFTFIAISTLALGIGANTAIFSLVSALLFRPLPYHEPQQLVWIGEGENDSVIHPQFLDWQEQSRSFQHIAAYTGGNSTLSGAGEAEQLDCGKVSAGFFPALGVQPALGRNFLPEEDRPGGDRVAIINDSLWRRRFNSDPNLPGKTITLDDKSYTVIGVLSPDFRFHQSHDIWTPLALPAFNFSGGGFTLLQVQCFGRLKPGVTLRQAQAELQGVLERSSLKDPDERGMAVVKSLHDHLVGGSRRLLFILFAAVGLVLLIACANVANLLLARASGRQKEFAIRAALGAGRLRLIRQMLTESLLLALAGGLGGLILAYWFSSALTPFGAADNFGSIFNLAEIRLDRITLAFTLAASLITAVLFGLAPALHFSRPDLNSSLKEGGVRTGVLRNRTRQSLMVAEVAVAVVLMVSAGLLIRSFVKLLGVDPGFNPERLLSARISMPQPRYAEQTRRIQITEQAIERISALPEVESAGAINHLPLTGFRFSSVVRAEGPPPAGAWPPETAPVGQVTPNYFLAMGIPLRAGRYLTEQDSANAPRVAIVNEAMAKKLFPNEAAIGKRIWSPGLGMGLINAKEKRIATIVGVVGDVKHLGLEQVAQPEIYIPYSQNAPGSLSLVIRSKGDPRDVIVGARHQVAAIDASLALYDVMTMEKRLSNSVAPRRFTLLLLGVFASLALVLASVGVYGVISYLVAQRAHEVGVRMALGAQKRDVLRLFVGQGMAMVVIGAAIGLLGALALTRVMTSLLFGVRPADPLTFACVALSLMSVSLLACYLPARRATKIDPIVALRDE
jgi:putative ABC transport system permease protein